MALLEKSKDIAYQKVIDAHTDQQVGYDTLTPKIITDDSVKPYFDALDFAFTKQDVKHRYHRPLWRRKKYCNIILSAKST